MKEFEERISELCTQQEHTQKKLKLEHEHEKNAKD